MEQQEFQHIAASLRPRLLKLCSQFFDSQELAYEAEDAVQETLLRLWQHRGKMENHQKPEPLAMLIAKNVCIDIMRRGGTWHDKILSMPTSKLDSMTVIKDKENHDFKKFADEFMKTSKKVPTCVILITTKK